MPLKVMYNEIAGRYAIANRFGSISDSHRCAINQIIQHHLGPVPAAGFFCAGEIGPVGGINFLHGFTNSMALFYPQQL